MFFALLFFLMAAHALMDYALQNDSMAICKCRKTTAPLAMSVPWYYWLTAHATLHGAAVGVAIRWVGFDWNTVAIFATAETVIHWIIDFGKCERWYSLFVDQALHVACKILWWALIVAEVTKPVIAMP